MLPQKGPSGHCAYFLRLQEKERNRIVSEKLSRLPRLVESNQCCSLVDESAVAASDRRQAVLDFHALSQVHKEGLFKERRHHFGRKICS